MYNNIESLVIITEYWLIVFTSPIFKYVSSRDNYKHSRLVLIKFFWFLGFFLRLMDDHDWSLEFYSHQLVITHRDKGGRTHYHLVELKVSLPTQPSLRPPGGRGGQEHPITAGQEWKPWPSTNLSSTCAGRGRGRELEGILGFFLVVCGWNRVVTVKCFLSTKVGPFAKKRRFLYLVWFFLHPLVANFSTKHRVCDRWGKNKTQGSHQHVVLGSLGA